MIIKSVIMTMEFILHGRREGISQDPHLELRPLLYCFSQQHALFLFISNHRNVSFIYKDLDRIGILVYLEVIF